MAGVELGSRKREGTGSGQGEGEKEERGEVPGAGQLLGTLRWARPPALALPRGASHGTIEGILEEKLLRKRRWMLLLSAWRDPRHPAGVRLIPGVLLEREVGKSLARTLLELPPPPTWLNHP